MKRIIFINLLIDRFWSKGSLLEKLFSVSNPESLRLSLISYNLGMYYNDEVTNSQDIYVCSLVPDEYWLTQFKSYHRIEVNQLMFVKENPFKMDEWLKEYRKIPFSEQVREFVFSAYSPLEEQMECLLNKESSKNRWESNCFLNDKTTLVNWIKKQDIAFPKTEIVYGENINISDDKDLSVYKFHLSSGGSGKFTIAQLKAFQPWIQSRGLEQEWRKSVWIKQEKLPISKEYAVFSHTESNSFDMALIEYDSASLSYLHFFCINCSEDDERIFNDAFGKIKSFLHQNSYKGYFGFDGFKVQNQLFPVVDLNVRMTKTHLLRMGLKKWNPKYSVNAFYRKRFFNHKADVSFKIFWEELCMLMGISFYGDGKNYQLFPFEVSGFSKGRSEVTFLLSMDSEDQVRALIAKIDLQMKKMELE